MPRQRQPVSVCLCVDRSIGRGGEAKVSAILTGVKAFSSVDTVLGLTPELIRETEGRLSQHCACNAPSGIDRPVAQ